MSIKLVASILVCLLLTLSIHSVQIPSVYAVGWSTHRFVASEAIELLPDDLDWFFLEYSNVIIDYSIEPDKGWGEGYWHWYHVDVPHGENDTIHGTMPWGVEDIFTTLVESLETENWEGAAQLAGVISHYIGDVANPLHTAENYNPAGKHGAFDGSFDAHLSEMVIDIPEYVPQKLENVFDSVMQLLEGSHEYVDVVSYYLNRCEVWNDELKDIMEDRLEASIELLANIWYTGMVQANLVVIPTTIDIHPETLNLKSRGRWITAYIELPLGYSVENIDVGTVMLLVDNDNVPAEPKPTGIGDHDNDSIADLMVKFNRSAVQALAEIGEVEMTVIGEVAGMPFEGSMA